MKNLKNGQDISERANAFYKSMKRLLAKYELSDKINPDFTLETKDFKFVAQDVIKCPKGKKPVFGDDGKGNIVFLGCQ